MNFSPEQLENELKNRWKYPYRWGKKQNDRWDQRTNFVYETPNWEQLVEKMKFQIETHQFDKHEFFQYAANRWYNFWSAVAVERIFTEIDGVEPAFNPKNRLVDFSLFGINFDHKTTVFPKGFGQNLHYAQTHPKELLHWLYANQSQQKRKHYENRLFIIVFDSGGEHWKLKAEISWLKSKILNYVAIFEASKLTNLQFPSGRTAVSDLIWAIK